MKNENGRSMIEMILVLALIGILSIGGVFAYKSAQTQNEANKIHELVSIASLNGLTKIKDYDNNNIWNAIGKKHTDYTCVREMSVNSKGEVRIIFSGNCTKVANLLKSQWGQWTATKNQGWREGNNTYYPPKDEE